MTFAASLWDVGLLTAACSLVVLLVSEVISPHYGRTNVLLNLRKLRFTAAVFVLAFVAIGIVNIVTLVSK
ncbi:MAG: hypothetical protein MN733_36450 [Nitrososphaera sp.]|nr:hypothetical protein [Nitrososphaera sp.]